MVKPLQLNLNTTLSVTPAAYRMAEYQSWMINADSAGPWTSLRWGINSVTGCAALNFSEKGYRRPSTVTDRQCAIQATRVSAHGGRGRAQWQCQPFGRQRQKSAQIKDHQTESIVEGIAVENLASESLISPSRPIFWIGGRKIPNLALQDCERCCRGAICKHLHFLLRCLQNICIFQYLIPTSGPRRLKRHGKLNSESLFTAVSPSWSFFLMYERNISSRKIAVSPSFFWSQAAWAGQWLSRSLSSSSPSIIEFGSLARAQPGTSSIEIQSSLNSGPSPSWRRGPVCHHRVILSVAGTGPSHPIQGQVSISDRTARPCPV